MKNTAIKTITSLVLVITISSTNALAGQISHSSAHLFNIKIQDIDFTSDELKRIDFTKHFNRVHIPVALDVKKNNSIINIAKSEDLYSLLGLTEDDFLKELASGKTLKELLVSADKVEAYKKILLEEYALTLEPAFINGTLSSSDYETLLQQYKDFLQKDDVFETATSENTNVDPVLNLLNMSYQEYRLELRKGETLTSLLEKANKKEEYNTLFNSEYGKIIKNAVDSGSLTYEEGENLIKQFA